ncbi:hypothetical protein [Geodermatophilus sp. CPCC 205506]|uniref:hypothetical protein n=1 Tax=Geodermatophilus sp. CPCC 205506 TaxID=2936596 RepID=UPI003EEBF3C6
MAGLVTTHGSWRWVFLGLLPLVVVSVLLVLPALRGLAAPAVAGGRWRAARTGWAALAGLGIAALQVAGQRLDLVAVAVALAGVVALGAGLRRLLPAGVVGARAGLPAVVGSRGLLAGAFFGMDVLLPLALTQLHGFSPTAAGIPLTAGAVGWATASQLQGRHPGVSRARLLRLGFVLLAAGVGASALVAVPGVGGWPAYLTWAVAGLGMGLGMPSVGVLLLEQSPDHRRGADSAAFQIADVTGSALCVGLVGVLVAAATASLLPLAGAVVAAAVLLAALAAVGALVAPRAAAPVEEGAAEPAATLAAS